MLAIVNMGSGSSVRLQDINEEIGGSLLPEKMNDNKERNAAEIRIRLPYNPFKRWSDVFISYSRDIASLVPTISSTLMSQELISLYCTGEFDP